MVPFLTTLISVVSVVSEEIGAVYIYYGPEVSIMKYMFSMRTGLIPSSILIGMVILS